MEFALPCYHCQKTIDKDGEIHAGRPYHKSCWTETEYNKESDELEDLYKAFPKIAPDVLDDLYELFDSPDELATVLNSNWCVITDTPNETVGAEAIDIEHFRVKKEMLDWITEQIYTLMLESYSWDIVYILRKGKIVANNGEIRIKVSI